MSRALTGLAIRCQGLSLLPSPQRAGHRQRRSPPGRPGQACRACRPRPPPRDRAGYCLVHGQAGAPSARSLGASRSPASQEARPSRPERPTIAPAPSRSRSAAASEADVQRESRVPGEPTRHRLFRCIADAPQPVGVAELTGYVRLHHNAVRRHLAVPRDAGLETEEAEDRSRPGRPPPAVPPAPRGCAQLGHPRGLCLARRRARPGRPGQAGGTPGRQHGHRRAAELTARLTRTTIWSRRWRAAASARPAPSAVGG